MSFFTLEESLDQYLIFGAVEIAAGAAIAARSILGTDANSQLIIASDTCIGAEVVIQARWGTLLIEAGVSIGSGVLIIGQGTIAEGACIGRGSTLINPQIEAHRVIPPDSLVGEMGCSRSDQPVANASGTAASHQSAAPIEQEGNGQSPSAPDGGPDADSNGHGPSQDTLARVYGQAHVNRMLDSLFPHRRSLDS